MPIALVNVAVHILGLCFALFGMRPGSPLSPFPQRMEYLAHRPLGWSLGWGVWMLCDFALVAFIFQAARRIRNDLAFLAVGLALVGTAIDLSCDALFIAVLPRLAARPSGNEDIFLSAERMINTVSLVMANGLITLSTATMTAALCNYLRAVPYITGLGLAILLFGLSLSAAGFMSDPWLAEWMTGPTILSYCVWCVVVARKLDRSELAA
jgi:hypothetical protein